MTEKEITHLDSTNKVEAVSSRRSAGYCLSVNYENDSERDTVRGQRETIPDKYLPKRP